MSLRKLLVALGGPITSGIIVATPAKAVEPAEAIYKAGSDAHKADDFLKALEAYSAACEAGLLDACARIEIMRRRGEGLEKDQDAANRELEALCERGGALGCSAFGDAFYFGHGLEVDIDRAAPLYRKACELDTRSGIACNNLAVIFRDGQSSTPTDPAAALPFFEKGCLLGSSAACHSLGVGLTSGLFGMVDFSAGIAALQKGCELERTAACLSLGWRLRDEDNPAPDRAASDRAFERACELGEGKGCTRLAQDIQDPDFGSERAASKLTFNRRACEAGYALGCYSAGWILHEGKILPNDAEAAKAIWAAGCALDTPRWAMHSCYQLANKFKVGPHAKINDLRDSQRALRGKGKWREALVASTRALEMFEELGHTANEEYALVLQQHALNLNEAGRDIEAADVARRSWETTRDVLGEKHRSTLNNAQNYATFASRAGDHEAAERTLAEVFRLRTEVLGPDDPDTWSAAKNRAIELHSLGRYDEAMALFDRGVAAMSAKVGPTHSITLGWRYSRARTLYSLGNIDEALATIEELIQHLSAGGSISTKPINVYILRASIAQAMGQPKQAHKLHRTIADFEIGRVGRDHRDAIAQMERVADILNTLGRYSEAEGIHRENLSLLRDAYGDDHPRTMRALSNLGLTLGHQGRFAERVAIHQQTLEQRRRVLGPNHPSTLYSMNSLAAALSKVGRDAEALRMAGELLDLKREVLGSRVPATLASARLYANLLARAGRHGEAEALYRSTLEIEIELQGAGGRFGQANGAVVETKRGLASLLREIGRPAEAEALLADLVPLIDRRLGLAHPRAVYLRSELMRSQLDQPGLEAAAWQSAQLIAVALENRGTDQSGESADMTEDAVFDRPELNRLIADAAWAEYSESGSFSYEAQETGFAAIQNAMDGPASRALALSAGRRLAQSMGEELGVIVRRREEAKAEFAQADAALTQALLERGDQGDELRATLEARKADLRSELERIDERLERDAPEYFTLVESSALSPADASQLLEADEAALLILPSDYGTHVMAITDAGITWHRSDWTRERVNEATRRLMWDVGANVDVTPAEEARWEREGEGAYPYDRSTAFEIYSALIAPLEHPIEGKGQLFVAAAGSLSSFPLAALVTEKPQGMDGSPEDLRATQWLADRFAISQLPSLQSLQFLRRFGSEVTDGGTPTMRGFGDPVLKGKAATRGGRGASRSGGLDVGNASAVFERTRGSGRELADVEALRNLARLPGTRTELLAIREALGAGEETVLLAENATEERFKSAQLSDVDILVLATHGLLAGEIDGAFEPGLVFTPPASPDAMDDGFLATSEVAELQLAADWVILSACNTAAGDGSDGAPGLSGLAKAFFFAGARNLLASHWPVRDDVAALITVRAIEIEREQPDSSRAEALQQAMIEVREDTRADGPNDTWAHPNAWAPFTLIGDGAK